ncbi:hypothetical protein IJM86_07235 [bacterium]|nr:hypothetical protein [bacterium]
MRNLLILLSFIVCIFTSCEKTETETTIVSISDTISQHVLSKVIAGKSETKSTRTSGKIYFKIPKGSEKIFISFGSDDSYRMNCTIIEASNGKYNPGRTIFNRSVSCNENFNPINIRSTTDEIEITLTYNDKYFLPSKLFITVGY